MFVVLLSMIKPLQVVYVVVVVVVVVVVDDIDVVVEPRAQFRTSDCQILHRWRSNLATKLRVVANFGRRGCRVIAHKRYKLAHEGLRRVAECCPSATYCLNSMLLARQGLQGLLVSICEHQQLAQPLAYTTYAKGTQKDLRAYPEAGFEKRNTCSRPNLDKRSRLPQRTR